MGAALFLRRDRFWAWGGWDEDFVFGGEDLEICHRVNQQAPLMYLPHIEITHFGRVSTRENIAYAWPNFALGHVKYLRKTGTSRAALFAYKLGMTLDAPLQILLKGSQYLWRRLAGRQQDAAKSLLSLHGTWRFLCSGLGPFWQA